MIAEHISQLACEAGATSIEQVSTENDAVLAARFRTPEVIISDVMLASGTGPLAVKAIIAEHGRAAPERAGVNNHLLEGRRLLVVEDEMLVLMVLEDMLDDLGCRSVTTAATVEDGLELTAHHSYDAALLDVNLGGSKSYPIAAALAASGTPFAFSTGYPDHARGTAFSDTPVLRKPYRLDDLSKVCAGWFPQL